MVSKYTLRLWRPKGAGFVEDVTKVVVAWQRSTRLQGGYWQGSFDVDAEPAVLRRWFHERLGYHLEEVAGGGVTWEGQIYEMELWDGGVVRRRSLADMANAVRMAYSSAYIGNTKLSAWQTAAASISRYGRKEELLSLETMLEAQATAQVAVHLAHNGWPWARSVSAAPGGKGKTRLTVTVCGYVFCANWLYMARSWADPGTQGPETIALSDQVRATVTTLADWLIVGSVTANATTTLQAIETPIRAWDYLRRLVALGGAGGALWRIYVGAGRRLHYGPVVFDPVLTLRPAGIFDRTGKDVTADPYRVQPGVLRDLGYAAANVEPGSALADARDMLVEEVAVTSDGRLSLRTAEWSAGDAALELARQQDANQGWLDDFWRRAWDADYARRKAEWEKTHPRTQPFPR